MDVLWFGKRGVREFKARKRPGDCPSPLIWCRGLSNCCVQATYLLGLSFSTFRYTPKYTPSQHMYRPFGTHGHSTHKAQNRHMAGFGAGAGRPRLSVRGRLLVHRPQAAFVGRPLANMHHARQHVERVTQGKEQRRNVVMFAEAARSG